MSPEQWKLLDDIFNNAIRLNPAERAAYAGRACGADAEMRRELERMLDGHERAEEIEFLKDAAWSLDPSPMKEENMIGKVIDGKYEIKTPIGEHSGMGDIYLAVEKIGGHEARNVVIKFAKEHLKGDDLIRFREEMLALAKLEHENIARIYHWGDADGRPYFVMEFLNGDSLSQFIAKNKSAGRGLDLQLVNEITRQSCDALHFAHERGVVHRDIKPQNIMILESNGKRLVKVIDFGIAKSADGLTRRATSGAIGTVNYMSPEQINPSKLGPVDRRSDIYSMGLVVYEMLTGRLAVTGAEVAEVVHKHLNETPAPPNVHDRIDRVVMNAIEKDRAKRPKTIIEFAGKLNEAIRSVLTEATIPDPPRPIPDDDGRPNLIPLWVGLTLLLLVSGYFAFQYWPGGSEAVQTPGQPGTGVQVAASPAPSVVSPPRPASSGIEAPAVSIYRKDKNNREEPVTPDTVFLSRQAVRFTITPPMDGYIYLIERGSRGDWTLIFPDSRMGTKNNGATAGKAIPFPPADAAGKPSWFTMDETPGDEIIYAFFTKEKSGKLVEAIEQSIKRDQRNSLKQLALDEGVEAMLQEAMRSSEGGSVKSIKLRHEK